MTRLEKYLYAEASETMKSDTTESRYFKIKNLLVRVSDHITTKQSSDIQIIIPTNHPQGLYTIILGDNGKVLVWNAKQIREFLPSLILIKEMSTKSICKPDNSKGMLIAQKIDLAKQENPEVVKQSLGFKGLISSRIKEKYASNAERTMLNRGKTPWNHGEIGTLRLMLKKEFGRNDWINDDFQIFLSCTSVNYIDVINIYKTIVIDNDKHPSIELLQEAYSYVK